MPLGDAKDDKTPQPPPDYEPAPVFQKNYRKAGCLSRIFWNWSWPMISGYHKNGLKIKEETLEDMYLTDGIGERLVEDLERNLKLRFTEMNEEENRTLKK